MPAIFKSAQWVRPNCLFTLTPVQLWAVSWVHWNRLGLRAHDTTHEVPGSGFRNLTITKRLESEVRTCSPPSQVRELGFESSVPPGLESSRGFSNPLLPSSFQPPKPKPENAFTIAVSSRVLFNIEKEQQIRSAGQTSGSRLSTRLSPLAQDPPSHSRKEVFDMVLMTNNHTYVNTINHHCE
ncbi:unnamed protein product [Merluccius merluccius]